MKGVNLKRAVFIATAAFLLLAALVAASSCGSSSTDTGASQVVTVSGKNAQVSVKNLAFDPPVIEVQTGTTVTWSNEDSVAHTITATGGAFDSGKQEPGKNFGYTFNTAGTYDYACTIHPQMKGKVIVTGTNP